MFDFANKKVLVAGGTGLIGIPLVEILIQEGAQVRIASLDHESRAHKQAEFRKIDLLKMDNCLHVCEGMDYVFNLLCAKGPPRFNKEKPATLFEMNLMLDVNMLSAAREKGADGYLLASSLAVYPPAEVFHEDDVWKGFPSKNDWFAGLAKRMGEIQAEAYRLQYGWEKISIVRPANTYGPYDDFESDAAMVIPYLIREAVGGRNPLRMESDGLQVRDFIHARDVARGMMLVAKKGVSEPVNLGSGIGYTIRQVLEIVLRHSECTPKTIWKDSGPSGDRRRVLDVQRARSLGFEPQISLEEGIRETVEWYRTHKDFARQTRFNLFSS
ncbi:MAG: NAD-dependent epimerase/dehydratase family protein [Candidatus Sungiibacteriota bacterium]|uniref:NAD-dependent epimerase/dehydratase family protein n=1 Tax=Candidatus Sungiibacteriota bacterium TaxID=2750080 RepID=A0A7T5RJV5_9BACT|nr:MAG: NAD-dependent epimerase/dehydratase family protein [Candidatus Sungbacteria bacterium]